VLTEDSMPPKKKTEKPAASKPKAKRAPAAKKTVRAVKKTALPKKVKAAKAPAKTIKAIGAKKPVKSVKVSPKADSAFKLIRRGETRLVAFIRDPQCLFTYWEVTPESLEAAKKKLGEEFKGSSM